MWLRSAGRADLEAICDLLRRAWHATYDGIYGAARVEAITAEWHSIEALRQHLEKPYSEFVVADSGAGLLGVAFASMIEEGVSQLHMLYVAPEAQGRGIGSELLQEMESAFPDATTMRLEVEAANSNAIAFYTRRGFRKAGSTNDCVRPESGLPALIFEKVLQWT